MKFESRNSSVGKMIYLLTFIAMFLYSEGTVAFSIKPDEVATVVGKAFSYKLPADVAIHTGYTFKLYTSGGEDLPSWLTFDAARNLLLGVPSHHDKGSHAIQMDVVNDETNKTAEVIHFLTIGVVQYDEDLNHYNMLRPSPVAEQSVKNASQSPLDCPGHMPVIVATLVFDLSARKLTGAKRVELLSNVVEWSGVDIDRLRWLPGKGDKTAFNLKDVILLTAGPGWISDAQERGVCVSWKIGCGENIAGSLSVIQLKSASETGAFKRDLRSPVVAWHVTRGLLKHRQVVRVRRQAPGQTPRPTSAFVPPTVAVVTRAGGVVGTPTIAPSPTVFTMKPTATRVSPSPTVTQGPTTTAAPFTPTDAPSPPTDPPIVTPAGNTPPYIVNPIGTLIAEANVQFLYPIPPGTFSDKEDGDTPNLILDIYNADGNFLPANLWLKLDRKSQILSGTPAEEDIGQTIVMLIVTDSGKLKSKLDKVTINVIPRNEHPPRLINHIDLIDLYVGQPLKFRVPHDTFYDVEDGDTNNLTLEMTTADGELLSPSSWVTFDAETHTIYALPGEEQIGKPDFLMAAKDSGGRSVRDAFEFHVTVANKSNHMFGLVLDASFKKFKRSVKVRVELCILIGTYFGLNFSTSYNDIRVKQYTEGSVIFEWSFANIATDRQQVLMYKEQYTEGDSKKPVTPFKDRVEAACPIQSSCPITRVYVEIDDPLEPTTLGPDVVGRVAESGDGTWWEYTIIPAFVVAAVIFIIGLIIILCIRCRRRSKLEKNDKVVFLYRKKPAVFREEYPTKEAYGNQPLITPSEKPPLPPPAYPRSSTPTEDPSVLLMSDSSPSYQPPSFDNGNEPSPNARLPVASYRLPPPYVAP